MGIVLQSKDYVAYLKKAAEKIAASRDYISDLDAVTGDGDGLCGEYPAAPSGYIPQCDQSAASGAE